jgi:hypothetical protein
MPQGGGSRSRSFFIDKSFVVCRIKIMQPTAYEKGQIAFKKEKCYEDNPYLHGSTEHEQWIDGYSDAFDDLTMKICKEYPQVADRLLGMILH